MLVPEENIFIGGDKPGYTIVILLFRDHQKEKWIAYPISQF